MFGPWPGKRGQAASQWAQIFFLKKGGPHGADLPPNRLRSKLFLFGAKNAKKGWTVHYTHLRILNSSTTRRYPDPMGVLQEKGLGSYMNSEFRISMYITASGVPVGPWGLFVLQFFVSYLPFRAFIFHSAPFQKSGRLG